MRLLPAQCLRGDATGRLGPFYPVFRPGPEIEILLQLLRTGEWFASRVKGWTSGDQGGFMDPNPYPLIEGTIRMENTRTFLKRRGHVVLIDHWRQQKHALICDRAILTAMTKPTWCSPGGLRL